MIDESKIICENCKNSNKANSYQNQFYFCNECHQNLCPLCRSNHNKSHNIINYEEKNYECNIHNKEKYNSYCLGCKQNICTLYIDAHENHDIKILKVPNNNRLDGQINELRKNIDKMNENIKKIIDELNDFMKYIEKYYIICKNFFNNYNSTKRNYETLENINNIISNDILNDINNIIKNENILYKFNKIIEIRNKYSIKKENNNKKEDIIFNDDDNNNNNSFLESGQNLFSQEEKFENNQKIKLIKSIDKDQPAFSLCFLKKII